MSEGSSNDQDRIIVAVYVDLQNDGSCTELSSTVGCVHLGREAERL